MLNWTRIVEQSILAAAPGVEIDTRSVLSVVETSERFRLRDMFIADPGLRGQTVSVDMLASANTDNWLKGHIDRSLPGGQRRPPSSARALAARLREEGKMPFAFPSHTLPNVS